MFDASSKAKDCISLNDCLEKGPNLLEEIPPILIKFREKKIRVTSDIDEKAFLQISLNESNCGCKRHSGRQLQTIPVALPEDRVKDAAVFKISGVDLTGPRILKGGEKAWLIVFTCAVNRAVHLVTSLRLVTSFCSLSTN